MWVHYALPSEIGRRSERLGKIYFSTSNRQRKRKSSRSKNNRRASPDFFIMGKREKRTKGGPCRGSDKRKSREAEKSIHRSSRAHLGTTFFTNLDQIRLVIRNGGRGKNNHLAQEKCQFVDQAKGGEATLETASAESTPTATRSTNVRGRKKKRKWPTKKTDVRQIKQSRK